MKKTLKLLVTEYCNYDCSYCCNKLPSVRERFQYRSSKEVEESIKSGQYKEVCITGGEPTYYLLDTYMMALLCNAENIPCYLYTNGLYMNNDHMYLFDLFTGINVGLHKPGQLERLLKRIDLKKFRNIRFYVWECLVNCRSIVGDLPEELIKTWKMNECFNNADNEDWIVLKE